MSRTCRRLEKDPSGVGKYSPSSIADLRKYIALAFRKATEDTRNAISKGASMENFGAILKKNVKEALYTIGNDWDNSQLPELEAQTRKVLLDSFSIIYRDFLPDAGIRNTISKRARQVFEKSISLKDYLEVEETNSPSAFLDKAFGTKATLKGEIKQEAVDMLLTDFIVDRRNGTLVENATDANRNVRRRKNELFRNIINDLKMASDNLGEMNINLFNEETGEYTGILENPTIAEIFYARNPFGTLNDVRIQELATSNPKRYRIFKDWFILKNYDNFLKLSLGNVINVRPGTENTFISGDNYGYADKHNVTLQSWRPDDGQVDLVTEISALIQSLVTSTPVFTINHGRIVPKTSGDKTLYLKFEDFYTVVTKMKDAVYKLNSYQTVSQSNIYSGAFNTLSQKELRLVKNMTLREIIDSMRHNPQLYGRIAFHIIANTAINNSDALTSDVTGLGFAKQDIEKIISIYKGFFDSSIPETGGLWSLKAIQQKYSHDSQNYYSALTQATDTMFSVKHLQFYDNDGKVITRELKDQSSDQTRRNIETDISVTHSKIITIRDFENRYLKPFNAKPIFRTETGSEGNVEIPAGIEFYIGDVKVRYNIHGVAMYDKNTQPIITARDIPNKDQLLSFLEQQLCLPLKNNPVLLRALESSSAFGENKSLDGMLALASEIYFNRWISNVDLAEVEGYRDTRARLRKIYENTKKQPGYNRVLNEIQLISENSLADLGRLATAQMVATGQQFSASVRDANGNLLSEQTLSCLNGSVATQHDEIAKYLKRLNQQMELDNMEVEIEPINTFGIFQPGVFKGHYKIKELRTPTGVKDVTQFTVSEFMQACFVHTFVGGFAQGGKIFKENTVGFIPSVNSDKTTIGQILIDLSKSSGHFNNTPYYKLTTPQIYEVICKELGDSYGLAYTAVTKDYNVLSNHIKTLGIDLRISPDDDFQSLNDYVDELRKTDPNVTASSLLYDWTLDYNLKHPQTPIKLTDLVHYVKVKGTPYIRMNHTFTELMHRYSNPANVERFFNIKRNEFFNTLLQEGFEVNLYNSENESEPIKYLRDKEFVKNGWVQDGSMVLGKVTYKGKVYPITNKMDAMFLQNLMEEDGINVDIIGNEHSLLDNPNIELELHPMLDKYNLFDYLFTQQFMIAGVGSHIAHPSKVKNKVPIVWGHPAIGKTYALNDPKYAHNIMDWDVEFNRKRDQWIANVTGTIIGTPAFQTARNEYLINWAKHDDYKQFVRAEWNKAKQKALAENKMLFASPAMLMAMFPQDFTKVITMGREDFIARGQARGDRNPEGWKDGIDQLIQFAPSNIEKIVIPEGKYLTDLLEDGTFGKELKQLEDNSLREEAARFLAQHKRNVSYTAAMHQFQLGQIDGIPSEYNMAMMEGMPAYVYTMSGDTNNGADAFDGATFVNPLIVIWENNSLNTAKAGNDKKPFVHFYDVRTGTGGIIKTAGFGLTNDHIREDKFYRIMMQNMLDRPWYDYTNTPFTMEYKGRIIGKGIFTDFDGRVVNYDDIYLRRNGKHYKRVFNSETSYQGHFDDGEHYKFQEVEVDENGEIIGTYQDVEAVLKSNYDLWKMFGGQNSEEMTSHGTLKLSERSIELTARAAVNYGYRQEVTNFDKFNSMGDWQHYEAHYITMMDNGTPVSKLVLIQKSVEGDIINVQTYYDDQPAFQQIVKQNDILAPDMSKPAQDASEVYQPMKHSDIHYMPTEGAVKQGIGNVNPTACYNSVKPLNFMKVKMTQAGIQLDKEHHADNSLLSLMTQVISAAVSKGYTFDESTDLYKALYELTKLGTQDFRDELGRLNIGVNGDLEAFKEAATKIILKNVINSQASDGDMMLAIAGDILEDMRKRKDFSLSHDVIKNAQTIIPFSAGTIFNKVVTAISVALTKQGIKTHMPGTLSVLCPAHEIIKFYKIPLENGGSVRVRYSKLEQQFGEDSDEQGVSNIDKLLELYQEQEPELAVQDLEMGYKYLVSTPDGNQAVYQIVRPDAIVKDFTRLKPVYTTTYKGVNIPVYRVGYQDIKKIQGATIKEWLKDGQDLLSYNVRFIANGLRYQMADLDIVQDFFRIKGIEDEEERLNEILKTVDKWGLIPELSDRLTGIFEKSKRGRQDMFFYNNLLQIGSQAGKYMTGTALPIAEELKPVILSYGMKALNRYMQRTLDAISPTSDSVRVVIDGQQLEVDKSSIKIQNYGCIMPKVFKSNFGLEEFDTVGDIVNDPQFFLKRLILKASTKVENVPVYKGGKLDYVATNYDIELKRNDGSHIYVRKGLDGSTLTKKVDIFTEEINGKIYRIDSDHNIMYELHGRKIKDDQGNEKLVPDEIYMDDDGNEIIITDDTTLEYVDDKGNVIPASNVRYSKELKLFATIKKDGKVEANTPVTPQGTSGIQFYLDTSSYYAVNINTEIEDAKFDNLVERCKVSKNKRARYLRKKLVGDSKANKVTMLKLNNYELALENNDGLFDHLTNVADDMRTSFLRSLDIIAARIPAQSQQSFMAMRVADFNNPDINSAYVSIFQFYLQGSDLDIDAVSMQVFDINESGMLQGHSPYYSLHTADMREASDELPFPTNKKLAVHFVDTSLSSEEKTHKGIGELYDNDLIGKDKLISITRENGSLKINVNLKNPDLIRLMAQLLNTFNERGNFEYTPRPELRGRSIWLSDKLGLVDQNQLTPEEVNYIERTVVSIIDQHNTYLKDLSQNKRQSALRNFITAKLHLIISNPINRLQADSSVDVVTGPVKELSKMSPKATVLHTFTPGNVANKMRSICENAVGKGGIAICATGLKSTYALQDLYYTMLKEGTADKLLFDIEIAGKKYTGLANGFLKSFKGRFEDPYNVSDQLLSEAITDYLFEQLWEDDAANNMSAFLGLSTDNAKELVLAKINASTTTMGMYLFGLAIGVPVRQLYDIMTSDMAFRIAELTKGDAFNGNAGTINVLGSISYLTSDPTTKYMSKFNKIDLTGYLEQGTPNAIKYPVELLKDLVMPEFEIRDAEGNLDKNSPKNFYDIAKGINTKEKLNEVIGKLRRLREKGASYYRSNVVEGEAFQYLEDQSLAIAKFNLALNFLLLYINDVASTLIGAFRNNVFGKSNLFEDLDKLAMGANEMKVLGQILRANQEIKTKPLELIKQANNVEYCIGNALGKLKGYCRRNGIKMNIYDLNGENMAKNKDAKEQYKVDLIKFFEDSPEGDAYAESMMELYDRVRWAFNPLRVIRKVPQYRGYWESIVSAVTGTEQLASKFKTLRERVPQFLDKNHIYDKKMSEEVHRNAENAFDTHFRKQWMGQWMRDNHYRIVLNPTSDSEPIYVFVDNNSTPRPNTHKREIVLGTTLGDANFKMWFENVVIKDLKKKYPDNKFVQALTPVVNTRTPIGSVLVNYSLNINMLPDPKNEYERDQLREMRESFGQLKKLYPIGFNQSMNVQDLFYIYSLISNNGKLGRKSLHSIFEDYDGTIVKSYNESIAAQDKLLTENKVAYDKFIAEVLTDEVLAPFSTPWKGGSDLIKYKNPKTGNVDLLKMKENQKTVTYDDDSYDPELDDIEQDMMQQDDQDFLDYEGDEYEGGYSNGINYSKTNYEPISGNMLEGANHNYFNYPGPIKYLSANRVASRLCNIITEDAKDGEKYITDIESSQYEEYIPRVIKYFVDNFGGKIPTVEIIRGETKERVPNYSEVDRMLEHYKNEEENCKL